MLFCMHVFHLTSLHVQAFSVNNILAKFGVNNAIVFAVYHYVLVLLVLLLVTYNYLNHPYRFTIPFLY